MRTNKHVYGERAFWVKGREAEMVKKRTLAVVIRLGDRSDRERAPKQWLPLFEPIPVYELVLGTGDPAHGINPEFMPDDGTTVQIVRRTVGRLGDLTDADLRFGSGSAVPKIAADVAKYLGTEMSPGKTFGPETLITVYWVEYLANEEPAAD